MRQGKGEVCPKSPCEPARFAANAAAARAHALDYCAALFGERRPTLVRDMAPRTQRSALYRDGYTQTVNRLSNLLLVEARSKDLL